LNLQWVSPIRFCVRQSQDCFGANWGSAAAAASAKSDTSRFSD
jgi:hypothetical protein